MAAVPQKSTRSRAGAPRRIPGYSIKKQLGWGGMATVYLAVQKSLDRPVALKLLNDAESSQFTERFINEGRIIASMNHRNIITVHDIGIVDKRIYISMEYIEGGDLKQRKKTGMTPTEALDIIQAIAGALGEAHKKGVIHRDVKPANILFRPDGTPLLADFGVAKDFERESDLTTDGSVMGTPQYISPEQAKAGPVDGRADIYSLGVIFYELLTGHIPYRGRTAVEILYKHLNEPFPDLPDEFQAFQPMLTMMVAKEPEDRFADASELLHAVMELRIRHVATRLERRGEKTSGKKKGRLRSFIRKTAFASVLVVAGGLAYVNKESLAGYMEAIAADEVWQSKYLAPLTKYFSWETTDVDGLRAPK